jgi:hypothetical protein
MGFELGAFELAMRPLGSGNNLSESAPAARG